jgi:hypothetical protein
MKYHVTYFYLASGMEGDPDTEDFGIIEAESEDEAKNKIAHLKYPEDIMYGLNKERSTRDFFKAFLSAKAIK